ncbi:serine hydrolase domain-containing protein [Corynebacterium sp. S7]
MKNRRYAVFGIIGVLLFGSVFVTAVVRKDDTCRELPSSGNSRITGVLEKYGKDGRCHRLSAFKVEGEITEFGGVGASASDEFEVASLTKVFTAQLLELQLDDGRISANTTVGSVLGPSVAGNPIEDVTVQELADHTSGLSRIGKIGMKRKLAVFFDKNPYGDISASDVIDLAGKENLKRRGETSYSNLGYALLGQVLAQNAGTNYSDLLENEILKPLDLDETYLMKVGSVSGDAPRGFTAEGRAAEAWEMDGFLPAAGLRSTAHDMALFARFLLDRGVPDFTWQKVENENNVYWHNGESFGFSSVMFIDQSQKTADFVASDTARSVTTAGSDLLKVRVRD